MPWVTDAPDANTVPSTTESAPEQAVSETLSSDSTVEGRAIEAVAPRQEAPVPPVVAEEPAPTTPRSDVTAPQPSVPQQEVSAPPVATEPPLPVSAERHIPKAHTMPSRHAAPAAPQLHEKRRVARLAAEPQTPASALRDIPVSSYAGDGTRPTIMIRPTSIQDVYYYSAPR